tara:strand:- start:178 stop:639 length:462 start_codon:yes stop_codon:yes gene_type:complete
MKRCSRCKSIKESSCFSIETRRKDGLCCYCKDCKKEIRKSRSHKSKLVAKKRLENMSTGIYLIKNTNERKIYIGQSIMIEQRRTQHFTDLRYNRHANKELQKDFARIGEDNFIHEIYIQFDSDDILTLKYLEIKTMLEFRDQGWILYNRECKR